jgi:hypothetical protein
MSTLVEAPAAEATLLDRVALALVEAGATLDGPRRRRLAVLSRSLNGPTGTATAERPSSGEPLDDLVHQLTVAPATVREPRVAELEHSGVPVTTYVEVVGLVARLTAIDTFRFGLGSEPIELPPAVDGQPNGRVADDATIDGGWVPTVGPASPPTALSMLPDEHSALHDVHGVFYLAVADMADLDADRGLHRTQMELVAARTSLLNECFF